MAYLITKDYQRIIQTTELNAITGNDVSVRKLVEGSTEIEMREYLIQRFDLDSEFTSLDQWSYSVIYKGNNRVYLDGVTHSSSSTYPAHSIVEHGKKIYINPNAITVPEMFTTNHWTLLGDQYDLFYVTLPYPLYDELKQYYKGDSVFWKDKTYTAVRDSIPATQQDVLQYEDVSSVRFGNIAPDERNGSSMWGTGTSYTIPAGTLPTDATKWTKGDNRNQHFVEMCMDIVVYKLCKRIAPNNVPEARHNAWLKAIEDLKAFALGAKNAQLPKIQPLKGQRVRYGGSPREIYTW